MMELRDYQREAIDHGIYGYFAESAGNPCISVPTGGGKSLIIAQFLREIYEQWPDQRVLILTHVKELIRQNHAELMAIWPEAPAGINSAGLDRRDYHTSIIFGGIQSLHKHAYKLQRIDLVIVDEAHLIPRSANTMYRRFLAELSKINPYLKVIGLTATPFRLDSGMLHQGDDALFSEVSYEANVRDLIDQGYLVRPRTVSASVQIDTAGVGTRGGEFIPGQLEQAVLEQEITGRIVDSIFANSDGRNGWLVFGCGIKHCEALADEITRRGIYCATIFGDTPKYERKEIIDAYKAREIRCLSSMGVLTTGFNAQHVDLIALARPTKSTGLYIQIVGRGLRTFPGKEDCLILDFGGNVKRHGPIDAPNVKEPGEKGEGDAPYKICPECGLTWPTAVRECSCGYEFPAPVVILNTEPSRERILGAKQPEWIDVTHVAYFAHYKAGSAISMRVDYYAGLARHSEWICLEHEGYARDKAIAWWRRRAPEVPVPDTVAEALQHTHAIQKPSQICVRPEGKFTRIVGAKI